MNRQQSFNPTKFHQLLSQVTSEELLKDQEKAYKGNKAAGVRVRKAMLTVKQLAQETRQEMTDIKKNLPVTKG
ncbi:histone H1 [Jiulongibacter sp. NS-SX5]|uniref:histone H1 n=1 Tax=Jiulongibacter sp. NS-SX5 TaxID=3463854 RepID=UPI004058D095